MPAKTYMVHKVFMQKKSYKTGGFRKKDYLCITINAPPILQSEKHGEKMVTLLAVQRRCENIQHFEKN